MYFKNAWYVAAWSNEVSRTMLERTMLEESILLYRKENGDPVAISNLCPHRFAPLSMGKLIGDTVQCAYHGMRFDCSGKCVLNPHDDGKIPAKMAVRSYPIEERHSLLWLWMGDPALAKTSTIPDFSCNTDTTFGLVNGVIEMKANYELIADNLLDLAHAEFIHEGILSSEAITLSKLETIQNGTTVYSKRWCPDGAAAPAWAAAFDNYDKPVDHWLYMRWDAPAHLLLDVGVAPVGRPRDEGVWVYATHILTPKDKFTTYYFWGVARSYKIAEAAAAEFWRGAIKVAFEGQDQPMIEAQQRMMGARTVDEMQPVMIPADAAGVRARRVLAKLVAEQDKGTLPQPKNRPLAECREAGLGSVQPVAPAL
jgi:phenylpropionate dioxygenase-like ring-hydroxylating dioxygenase large terminal subunit